MEGDNKVVNIIEDWDVLAEYAGEKLGFYQLLGNDGTIEIRVQTGRIGFKKEFDKRRRPALNQNLGFLQETPLHPDTLLLSNKLPFFVTRRKCTLQYEK